jgi:predicted HNH restriction endonuclease
MFSVDNLPKQNDYVRALDSIKLTDNERKLLNVQFRQPGRAITSQECRDLFGYGGIGGANFLYGKLAKKIANALQFKTFEPGERLRHWWRALSSGQQLDEHFTWTMRPQVANALIKLGIVERGRDGKSLMPDIDIHGDHPGASEGTKKLVAHLRRERNRAIVAAKKAKTRPLRCEICSFDFKAMYGVDYCEAHHLIPLGDLDEVTVTSLDDLAVVCANCHRVIHLFTPPLTIEQMRKRYRG